MIIIFGLCFPGYAFITFNPVSLTLNPQAKNSYIYSPQSYFSALNFLDNLEKDKTKAVLAEDEAIGRLIPAATGCGCTTR